MSAVDLKPEQFSGYPPEARKLVTNDLAALQRLPLSFLPSLLREVIDYDFKFPAERKGIEKELANLSSLSAEQTKDWFQAFAQIRLSPAARTIRLDKRAGAVCRAALGVSLDDASTGCISRGGARLRGAFAGGSATGTSCDAQAGNYGDWPERHHS